MKKIFFGLLMFFALISNSFAGETSRDIQNIAFGMLIETKVNGNNIEALIDKSNFSDANLTERFEALTVDEKYQVLEIVRAENLKKFSGKKQDKDELLLQHVIGSVIHDLQEEGIFIGDLSSDEIKAKLIKSKDNFVIGDSEVSQSSSSSCPLKSFPLKIYHSYKSIYDPYVSAYYYSNVITEAGEWPCDTELWYNGSKNRVYGLIYGIRQMILNPHPYGYGGSLSKRTDGGNDRLVVGIKAALYGYNDYALSQIESICSHLVIFRLLLFFNLSYWVVITQ